MLSRPITYAVRQPNPNSSLASRLITKNPMRRSWLDDTDGGWIAHRLVLLVSPAWHGRPAPLRTVLERLEIEHLRHGGRENGHLFVSYDQFVKHGVSRKAVRPAIRLGERLGLLAIVQGEEPIGNIRAPNRYRLTYVPEKRRRAPTDEWSVIDTLVVKRALESFKAELAGKTGAQFPSGPHSSALMEPETAHSSALLPHRAVPKGELSTISAGYRSNEGPTPVVSFRSERRRDATPAASAPSLGCTAPSDDVHQLVRRTRLQAMEGKDA